MTTGRFHVIAKFTRRTLEQQRDDWTDWAQSEYKQLDQYNKQDMFTAPIQLPPDAAVLNWVWTYVLKTDGTKKARGLQLKAKHFIAAPPTDQADDIGINVGTKQGHGPGGAKGTCRDISGKKPRRVGPRKMTAALSVVEMLVVDVTLCQHSRSK
jgi:hypothetical protein